MNSFITALTTFLRRIATRSQKPSPRPLESKQTQANNWSDSLDADLLRYLYQELERLRRDGVRASHWVVGEEWWLEILKMRDSSGRVLCEWSSGNRVPCCLFGIPVYVHSWANVPTLAPHR